VLRGERFEICENYCSRQDFLLCAILSQFAAAFFIHVLRGNWITHRTGSGYFFLRFFEDDFLKLSLRRGASDLSLSLSLSLRSLLLSSCIDLQSIIITCGFGKPANQQEFI
jgi:hypothetical protein